MTSESAAPPDDREEFLARYLAAQPSLRSYLQAVVGPGADADDVLQEVSLAMWREFARFDRDRPFIAWAIGIARNHVARWRRGRGIAARRFSPQAEAALAVAYEELDDGLVERRTALRGCIDRLGPQARELLELRYRRGLDLADLARLRASSVNAVNKALGRIRRLLGDCADRAASAR